LSFTQGTNYKRPIETRENNSPGANYVVLNFVKIRSVTSEKYAGGQTGQRKVATSRLWVHFIPFIKMKNVSDNMPNLPTLITEDI
jgi:hypothetical protein